MKLVKKKKVMQRKKVADYDNKRLEEQEKQRKLNSYKNYDYEAEEEIEKSHRYEFKL